MRSCCDQDHVGWKRLFTVCSLGDHPIGAVKPAAAGYQV